MIEYVSKKDIIELIETTLATCHQMAVPAVAGLKYSIASTKGVTFDTFTPREKVIFEVAMERESAIVEDRNQESRIDTNYGKSCKDVIEKVKNSPFWL